VKVSYVPSCIRPEFKHPLDNVFCVVIVATKLITDSPNSLICYTAEKQDTFRAYNQSYTYAQPAVQTARVNSVATRVY